MNVKMGPISADITRYVRIQEAAITVYVPEVSGLKELEDPVWVSYQQLLLNNKAPNVISLINLIRPLSHLKCFLGTIRKCVSCFK